MAEPAAHAHDLGVSWVHDEVMQRAFHAVADAGRVWLVDPTDADGVAERAATLGEVAGVIQLLDRHNRGCTALADRLGVPHHRLPGALPDTPFEVVTVLDLPGWRERALWWPQRRALIVAETLGTGRYFALGRAVGLHPMLRLLPPGALRRFAPEHLLPGHGAPLHGPQAAAGVADAYARARTDLPRFVLKLPTFR